MDENMLKWCEPFIVGTEVRFAIDRMILETWKDAGAIYGNKYKVKMVNMVAAVLVNVALKLKEEEPVWPDVSDL